MGCSASKSSTATVDYYRPPPSSFAVFDVNAIDDPWVKAGQLQQENQEKPTHVLEVILEKLNALEAAPYSWDEVSKALEDLKPAINDDNKKPQAPTSPPKPAKQGGNDIVVIYTTSLRGVRRTFEDCNKVRGILEVQRVVFEERDVSLHGEFLSELRELVGDEASVPRVFVKGRYLGGAEAVSELNETGKLGKILSIGRVDRGVGRLACGGCGGARFVPCVECGGSCKVAAVSGEKWERCGKCNENGLIHCPTCL
ncbi:hypothetical protein F3Y22_tig00005929pilonHSYRG00093 [Hibiscus syriacus]|uniref:Glutaredoxin domain-containing protein n=1 Tax=Hibiscus syriacus TaxID=106335 RepID=A0A6A3CCX5_HIBSY|nr:hypothetical protein F3Y22_tig00005929pilonHSYRG00093 [Hibiscus syriacus]